MTVPNPIRRAVAPGVLCLLLALPSGTGAQTLDPEDLVSIVIECSNGVDDDGDGLVDFPDDPGCASAQDEAERTPTRRCGVRVACSGSFRCPPCRRGSTRREPMQLCWTYPAMDASRSAR